MNRSEIRINASYLTKCELQSAYDWLKENWTEPKRGIYGDFWEVGRDVQGREVLERLLVRRNDLLIDLGIARFGYFVDALESVFARGDIGVRCAVLSNAALFHSDLSGRVFRDSRINFGDVAANGNLSELEALVSSPYLKNAFISSLIKRENAYQAMSDERYKHALMWLGDNPRMAREYDATYMDGGDDYLYHEVFNAAWELTKTVPADQTWAQVLGQLFSKAQPPIGFEDVDQVLERWRIDGDAENLNLTSSFWLRSRVADLKKADDELANSDDLALRASFYRRFPPKKYDDWTKFFEKDGEEFVLEALSNDAIWKREEFRDRLSGAAWACPDPHSRTDAPNYYRSTEKRYQEEHPEWFEDEDIEDFFSQIRSRKYRNRRRLSRT